jgi:hypothetical protein
MMYGNGNRLGLASALISGRDLHDSVRVDSESDLDLRHTAGGGWDVGQLKLAEEVVVPKGNMSFAHPTVQTKKTHLVIERSPS